MLCYIPCFSGWRYIKSQQGILLMACLASVGLDWGGGVWELHKLPGCVSAAGLGTTLWVAGWYRTWGAWEHLHVLESCAEMCACAFLRWWASFACITSSPLPKRLGESVSHRSNVPIKQDPSSLTGDHLIGMLILIHAVAAVFTRWNLLSMVMFWWDCPRNWDIYIIQDNLASFSSKSLEEQWSLLLA